MSPTILSIHAGCTRVLDAAIATERMRYAAERLDFHHYFRIDTVPDLQRVLRGETRHTPRNKTRSEVVVRILRAQRRAPHALWTLLLLQAFEPMLVRRRATIDPSVASDALLVETFLATLADLPRAVVPQGLIGFVTRASLRRLMKALPATCTIEPAPESGVLLRGERADDESTGDLGDVDPSEVG